MLFVCEYFAALDLLRVLSPPLIFHPQDALEDRQAALFRPTLQPPKAFLSIFTDLRRNFKADSMAITRRQLHAAVPVLHDALRTVKQDWSAALLQDGFHVDYSMSTTRSRPGPCDALRTVKQDFSLGFSLVLQIALRTVARTHSLLAVATIA
ncbi:hypothetical protein GALMADRAFT_141588 [Galerina marginata CBS 339.88]|uniref:Uncharacterized protein n=1 Tax=Galerina marginata (strain CBS 339.88) TaxID=685588 RepID=A0A067T6D9_GALM3|nr:hypothetical protein GALMADRAFT_141588 [Galerina marginata CBS 339.88]